MDLASDHTEPLCNHHGLSLIRHLRIKASHKGCKDQGGAYLSGLMAPTMIGISLKGCPLQQCLREVSHD